MNAIIPECNITRLEETVEQLNKRCRRLGLPEITVTKTLDHVKAKAEHEDPERAGYIWLRPEQIGVGDYHAYRDTSVRMAWWSVDVTGSSPKLNGWEFIAVLEPMKTDDGETLNLVQCLPGVTCPHAQRTKINVCDHCNARRARRQTFVLRNGEEYKSVGRQCLKDFLGYHASVESLVSQAEILASLSGIFNGLSEFDEGFERREEAWDIQAFLTTTACRIRLFGWLSVSKAGPDATKYQVLELYKRPPSGSNERKQWEDFCDKHVVTEADADTAVKAIDWARNLSDETIDSEYLANCNLIARVGIVSKKTAGIACSIVSTYQREVEKIANTARLAARPASVHIGTVGERIKLLNVTVDKIIAKESQFGVTHITKMHDADGNDVTWFCSGEPLSEGQTYTVSATVIRHDAFNGRPQTIVNRVVTWSEQGLAAEKAKAERKAARDAKKARV